jgi:hypothetical protein
MSLVTFSFEPAQLRPDVRNARSYPVKPALLHPNVGDAISNLPHNPGRTAGQQVDLTGRGNIPGLY